MAKVGHPTGRTPYTGTHIPALLERMGWTHAELAGRMGYSRPSITLVLSGRRGISPQFVAAACGAFGLPAASLFFVAPLDTETETEIPETDK
jgi:transcriptional regulator with XRE-family HTH domain